MWPAFIINLYFLLLFASSGFSPLTGFYCIFFLPCCSTHTMLTDWSEDGDVTPCSHEKQGSAFQTVVLSTVHHSSSSNPIINTSASSPNVARLTVPMEYLNGNAVSAAPLHFHWVPLCHTDKWQHTLTAAPPAALWEPGAQHWDTQRWEGAQAQGVECSLLNYKRLSYDIGTWQLGTHDCHWRPAQHS